MANGGMLRYCCRMCGEEFDDRHVPDISLVIRCLVGDGRIPPIWSIPPAILLTIHNGRFHVGIADLIGGVEDAARGKL